MRPVRAIPTRDSHSRSIFDFISSYVRGIFSQLWSSCGSRIQDRVQLRTIIFSELGSFLVARDICFNCESSYSPTRLGVYAGRSTSVYGSLQVHPQAFSWQFYDTQLNLYFSLSQLQRLFIFLLLFLTDFAINERINLREFSFYFSAALAIRDSNREWD